jgi:hypothetical protein
MPNQVLKLMSVDIYSSIVIIRMKLFPFQSLVFNAEIEKNM